MVDPRDVLSETLRSAARSAGTAMDILFGAALIEKSYSSIQDDEIIAAARRLQNTSERLLMAVAKCQADESSQKRHQGE